MMTSKSLATNSAVSFISLSSGSYEGMTTIVLIVLHRSPLGELSPFLSANSNVQHEPKSYLKAVEKNEETI